MLGLALVLLLRSMNKHLRRVPGSFEPAPQEKPPEEKAARMRPDLL